MCGSQEELQEGDEEVREGLLKQLWEPQACLVAHLAPGQHGCPRALTAPVGAMLAGQWCEHPCAVFPLSSWYLCQG